MNEPPPINGRKSLETVDVDADRLKDLSLMVHTKYNKRIIPISELRELNFNPLIHTVLKELSIASPKILQQVSWPTILQGSSVFMISPSHTGKTLGYVPAVSNLVLKIPNDKCGPICIIVCATIKSVCYTTDLCKRFLGTSKIVLCYHASIDEQKFAKKLSNGCDILVSTLPALIRLFNLMDSNKSNVNIDLKRFSILVLDDYERLNEVHDEEIKILISTIKNLLKMQLMKIQIIIASRIWCDFMGPLARWALDTVVCIGSYVECALYSKAYTSIDFLQNNNKLDAVIEFMKAVDTTKKTVIVCQTYEEVAYVAEKLKQNNKYNIFETNKTSSLQKLHNLNQIWLECRDSVLAPVLVCCDESLNILNITDAHNLLHYSLPKLYSTFVKRFSILRDTYRSVFQPNNSNLNVIKLLINEENCVQIPKVLHFAKRCTQWIPMSLNKIADKFMIEKDFLKAQQSVPLCEYILLFGQCPDLWNCKARHSVFKKYDTPPEWVPKQGIITFTVMNVKNAVMCSARLLSQIENNNVFSYPRNCSVIALKMASYYSKKDNRKPHGVAKLGDVCAVAIKRDLYQRAEIMQFLTFNSKGDPDLVLVKLVDEGKCEKAKAVELYYLPPELKSISSYIVQIQLGNMVPKDKDLAYSYVADDLVKKMMTRGKNLQMKAEVVIAVGTTIIVDKLEVYENLLSAKQIVIKYNLKDELLKSHALFNDVHLTELQKMIEQAGLILGDCKKTLNNVKPTAVAKTLPKTSWAFLTNDDFSAVCFGSAKNLSQIFVRLVKFQDCLVSLSKDIQRHVASTTFDFIITPKNGELVLAKFPDDGLYYRARIQKVLNENKCECFFVDLGHWRDISVTDGFTRRCNIIPILEKFVTQMPFQAIECRLVGIQPLGEEWTEFSTNWFCDQCYRDNSDKMKELYVKYFTTETSEFTDGYKYGIVMIDTTGPQAIVINQMLLDANLAKPHDNETIDISEIKLKKQLTETLDVDDNNLEKDLDIYEDNYNKSEVDVNEKKVKNSLDHLFLEDPTRIVPLVDYDSDSMSDGFSVDFDQDDIQSLFNPLCKNSAITELPSVTNDKFSNQLSKHLYPQNIKEEISLSAATTKNVEQNLETAINVMTNGNHPPSISSNFEAINSRDYEKEWNFYSLSNVNKLLSPQRNATESKLIPKLCWNQTKSTISIKIGIIGVEKYEITIKDRIVKFSSTVNDIEYAFDIELYGVIKPNMSKHCAKGLYVLVTLYKLIYVNWLSLTRDNKVKRWILYDPDFIEVSEDEEDSRESIFDIEKLNCFIQDTHTDSDRESDEDFIDDTFLKY